MLKMELRIENKYSVEQGTKTQFKFVFMLPKRNELHYNT